MLNIINTNGEVQLNTPYSTNEELQACGLTDWQIATDEEVETYKNSDTYKQELQDKLTQQKIDLQTQIDYLERIAGVRAFREYMLNKVKDVGTITGEYPNGKTLDIDNQIKYLRGQINDLG